MGAPKCSGCGSSQVPAILEGVEAHRCDRCPGVWVDLASLEKAAGESFELQALGEASQLGCGRCGRKMTQVLFPGGIPLEGCEPCRGVFLRDGKDQGLVEVVFGLPARRRASKQKAKASDGFKIASEMLDGLLSFFK